MTLPRSVACWIARWLLAVSATLCLASGALAQGAPRAEGLKVGVVPNVSVRVILANYRPVRDYFARELKMPVEILSAPDFPTFHGRTVRGEYDVVVTAANLGRLAQLDHGSQPVATYEPGIPGLAIMLKDAPIPSVQALRGKALALANPQSLVAMRGFTWLEQQGLRIDADYHTVHVRNDDSLGRVLESGEAPLALMSAGEFRQIDSGMRAKLVVFAEFARVPGFFVMADRSITAERLERLRALWLALPQSEEGREFAKLAGVTGIRTITSDDLAGVDPYLPQMRAQMGKARSGD